MILFQIDEWVEYATVFSAGAEFEKSCTYVDNHLSLRTFLVGYSLSVADIAVWSGLAGMLFIIGHLYICRNLIL
jgi:glutamyl-tRNA synthetase